jgi:imidazolonepropionase-like amidohydrolase
MRYTGSKSGPSIEPRLLGLAFMLCWMAAARAQEVIAAPPYAPDGGTLAVRCGTLIDGLADAPRSDVTVRIERGRIVALGRATPAGGAPVLDLGAYTCLPGLIDMHTHIVEQSDTADLSVYYTRTPAQQVENGRRNALATLRAGFTSVRDVGTYIAFTDTALREEIAQGRAIGPRVQGAGFYLTVPGGGGDLVIPGHAESEIPAHARLGVARGPQEFARRAERALDGGADLVKVIASGAVLAYGGVPGEREMSEEEIAAVVRVAHGRGRKVAAHAHGAESIKDAIRAGADTIEHASLIDDEGIALARAHGVALSMDVYNGDYIDTVGRAEQWPEEFLRKNLETTGAQRHGFARAWRAGVPIVFGTDAAVYPHGDNAKQFRIMVEHGMPPMDAIKAATSVAARYMGWAADIGSLAPGRYGDLIAVLGDPLADIGVLERVEVVVKGGLVFKRPAALAQEPLRRSPAP